MTAPVDEFADIDVDSITIEEDAPKRTRRPRSDKGQTRTSGRGRTALADELLVPWATIAAIVSQPLPLVGAVMLTRGEATTKAMVSLAKGHPKMLAALNKVAKAGPASELVQTGALMLAAVAIETGRIPADSSFAQRLAINEDGVSLTDAYYQLHPDRLPQEENPDFPFGGVPDNPLVPPGMAA